MDISLVVKMSIHVHWDNALDMPIGHIGRHCVNWAHCVHYVHCVYYVHYVHYVHCVYCVYRTQCVHCVQWTSIMSIGHIVSVINKQRLVVVSIVPNKMDTMDVHCVQWTKMETMWQLGPMEMDGHFYN